MDKELQSRSGLNIGIESSLLPFVQAGAGEVVEVALSGDTVVAEHTDQAARVPFLASGPDLGSYIGGWAFNTDPALVGAAIEFDFVDELGNRITAGGANLVFGGPNPIFNFTYKNDGFFCLAPGEKIVARFLPPGP